MLILNDDLWEKNRIIKICCSSKWKEKDSYIISNCILKRLKKFLIEAHISGREGILLCDCNKGEFPPMLIALEIVKFMVSIKKEIQNGLLYTIIYVKSVDNRNWINNILKIYKPAKPVKILSTKEEVKNYLLENDLSQLYNFSILDSNEPITQSGDNSKLTLEI